MYEQPVGGLFHAAVVIEIAPQYVQQVGVGFLVVFDQRPQNLRVVFP